MNKRLIVGMVALAGCGISAGHGAETEAYQVTIYVQDQQVADLALLARAKALTTRMFAGIGVRLRWDVGAPRSLRGRQAPPEAEIVISFASKTPTDFHPGALAYSRPYAPPSEVRVTIFYNRVLALVIGERNVGAALLGHVLTHEITHVLQGVVRHSDAGVMRDHWTAEDRMQMTNAPLSFTDYDVELIRLAMPRCQGAVQNAAR